MAASNPRANEIFSAVVKIDTPDARQAYLENACGGNVELRGQVEVLLQAHGQVGDLRESPADQNFTAPFPPPTAPIDMTAEQPGDRINQYKLLQKLGEGGMGAVWAAEQSEPVKRRVALKLIKAGMDSSQVLRRFEAERQALALMEHPNIAKVLDAGATPQGRPYFAMELIKGIPITKYCDQEHLTPRERLELFIPVCQAVQHAHQKGIIHRDLKPSNVLIALYDGKPVPKVIDFGVAKATSQRLTEQTMYTEVGQIVGTLEYMAPEQAELNNLDIDTRADIYSLGVILYELVAGSPPFTGKQLRGAAFTEMLRMIREVEPPRPSTRLSSSNELPSIAANRKLEPSRLTRQVHGDLDWIVMKALEKDRGRRYETANGFAMDIQRYLADEVVEARPPSAGYRLSKFARRHRGQVVAASLVLLSLVLGMVGTTWGLIHAARANAALAAANADLTVANVKVQARYDLAVDAIKTFHTGVSEDFLLKEEKFKELRDRLLKSASDFYGKLSALLDKETDLSSRRALAAANFELAGLTTKVGRNEEALAAHRAVLAVRKSLAAGPEADAETSADVGRSLTEVAGLLESSGKTDEALAAYREAEGLLSGAASSSPEPRAALAACRSRMGGFLTSIGKNDEALAAYRMARSDQQDLVGILGDSPLARRELGDTVNRIGRLLANTGRPREASDEYRTALAIRKKLADANPAVPEFRNDLAACHNNLALVLWQMGQLKEAEAEHRTALAIREKLANEHPAVSEFRKNFQASYFNLANLLRQTGRLKEAEAEYRTALSICEKLADDNPAVPDFRRLMALNHQYLATVLKGTGRAREAETEFRAALPMLQALVKANPTVTQYRSDLGSAHNELGALLAESSRTQDAETEFRAAIKNGQELVQADPAVTLFRDRLATSHANLGELLSEAGRSSESESEYGAAEAIFRDLAGANAAVTYFRYGLAHTQVHRGILLSQAGQMKEANAVFRSAAEIYQVLADQSPKVPDYAEGLASALTRLGDVVRSSGQTVEARDVYDRTIALRERLVKENPTTPAYLGGLAFSLRRRGLARRDLGDPAGAAADVRRALGLYDGLATRSREEWYETACCHAALASPAGGDGSGTSAAEGKVQADQAMAVLRKAVDLGYRNASNFRTETALDKLRVREDFKKLVAKLEMKSNAEKQ